MCTDLRDYNIDFVQPISLIDAIQNRHTPKNANTFDTENLSNIRPLNTKMYNFPGVRQYKDRKRKPTLAPKLELGEKKYPILLDTTKLTTRIHPFYFQDSTEIYPKAEPLKSLCHMNRSHLWENDMYFELNTAIREDIDANYKVSIASNEKSITDKAYRNRLRYYYSKKIFIVTNFL